MALAVRMATLDDAAELSDYAGRLFSEELPGIFRRPKPTVEQEVGFISSRIDPANSTLLVAVEDGAIVGVLDFVGGSLAEETHTGTFGLSVANGFRGRGIGTALLCALFEWAPSCRVTRIQCWAWVNNPRAIELYERLGFEREGYCREAIRIDGEPIDVVLLARLVEARQA